VGQVVTSCGRPGYESFWVYRSAAQMIEFARTWCRVGLTGQAKAAKQGRLERSLS